MTVKYYAILTNQGAARLANATMLGSKLNLTQMAVGDANGVLPTPDPAQTKLINQKRIAPLNLLSVDPNNQSQIIAEQIIPESEGGFWIREIGLYDDKGVLIAVANCPETYKPQLQEGSGRTQTIRMILVVTNTEAITLKIDPSVVLATRKYVDDKISEHEQSRRHPDASLTAKGFVQLSSATNSTSETLAATPKAVKAAYDLAAGKAPVSHTHPWSQITGVPAASLTAKGTVQLSSAINSTSEILAATPKAVKAAYDLANGKQPADATLTALAGLATAANRLPYFTGADRAALTTLTAIGRAIIAMGSIKEVLNYLGLGEGSALPVGVPVPWPTATPPAGWLQCNGATFTKEQYPVLARVYPTLRLPDLRGEFIRGWDGGRKVDTGRALLSFQEGTIVSGFDDNDTGDISSLGSTQYGFGDALTSNQLGVINGKKWIFDASSKGAQKYDWWAYVSARPRNIAFNYIVRAA
ncbi:TPA: phage tail protein [Salmonella enterica subsp. enterica serovar Typhi]|nr:phage tail protein [Salmonella enterica subsp. enterica serovar Typhi]